MASSTDVDVERGESENMDGAMASRTTVRSALGRRLGRLLPRLSCLPGLLVTVVAFPARGAPPVCFPERTILQAAEIKDDQGRVLGGARAGQVVRVLSEGVADRAAAMVEVDAPVSVRGYVATDVLRGFLKNDVAVRPGRVWMLAGTPVQIVAQSKRGIQIRWVGPHGEASERPLPNVSCAALVGRTTSPLPVDGCHGALPGSAPPAAGQPVHFLEEPVVAVDGTQLDGEEVGLLRQTHDRAYIEVIQARRFSERLRIRAWVSRADIAPGPPRIRTFSEHLCCEGVLGMKVGSRGGVLARAVDLRVDPQAAPFAHVPAGVRFRVLGPPNGEMRRIALRFPKWDHVTFQLALNGWVPVSLLPALPDLVDGDAVLGRLTVEGTDAPFDFQGFEISASSEGKDGEPPTVLSGRDGRFVLKVDDAGPLRLDARSPDGALAGAIQGVTALPGGDEEVTIPLRPAAFIEGRVRNSVGAWLPNVEVLGMADSEREPSIRAVTDGRGQFRMPVVPGKYALTANEPGQQWSNYVNASAPGDGVVLELWRRRVILGAVPRAGQACATREVEIEAIPSSTHIQSFRRRYAVAPDCTFAADEVGRAWNPIDITAVDVSTGLRAVVAPQGGYRRQMWDEDPEPVCVGGGCAPGWQRASIHANVVDSEGVLLATPTVVDVMIGGVNRQTCNTSAGTCFVHGLAPRGTATVTARLGTKSTSAKIELAAGVREILLRLD